MRDETIRPIWSNEMCAKAARYAPKNAFGDRPPKGIVYNSGSPYPCRYGGVTPWPDVPEPWGFFWLSSWGAVITTKENAAKRKLPPLNLDENGRWIEGKDWYERRIL